MRKRVPTTARPGRAGSRCSRGFPRSIVERLLVASHRHCSLCHKPAGVKIEIHHIVPRSDRGTDTEENGMPLCFDCHAEVHYEPNHPRGRRITQSELRRHKAQWFAICRQAPWAHSLWYRLAPDQRLETLTVDRLRVDDRRPAVALVASMIRETRERRLEFARKVFAALEDG